MPVIYKSFQSVLANKEGKKLFYPRVVLTGNVDTEQVAKEIAELSSLSTGDSKNVIDNLVTVMTRHLQSSESVTLDGLGTFRLTMKSTMNGVEDPLKVSATPSLHSLILIHNIFPPANLSMLLPHHLTYLSL